MDKTPESKKQICSGLGVVYKHTLERKVKFRRPASTNVWVPLVIPSGPQGVCSPNEKQKQPTLHVHIPQRRAPCTVYQLSAVDNISAGDTIDEATTVGRCLPVRSTELPVGDMGRHHPFPRL